MVINININKVENYESNTEYSLLTCKFSSNLIGLLQATAEIGWWYWLELLTGWKFASSKANYIQYVFDLFFIL